MTLTIPANDFGQIRIFEVRDGLPAEMPEVLATLFGTDALDPTYVDVINIIDLSSMSLTDYIRQGYDIEIAEHDISAVNRIEGHAILIMSSATRGEEVTLTLAPQVRHVTTYVPDAQIQVLEPLSSDGATGVIGDPPVKPAKSQARISGMIAMYVLIAMMLLVGLMIWIA
ncbi:hypothetical protein [Yoonia sp. 2307UL14-13]|uniref:hypothetical protein n=1 Tax=Yoonia sp. 2307UL14-13 TaxID=3126506 RepID=UPI00309BC66C